MRTMAGPSGHLPRAAPDCSLAPWRRRERQIWCLYRTEQNPWGRPTGPYRPPGAAEGRVVRFGPTTPQSIDPNLLRVDPTGARDQRRGRSHSPSVAGVDHSAMASIRRSISWSEANADATASGIGTVGPNSPGAGMSRSWAIPKLDTQ